MADLLFFNLKAFHFFVITDLCPLIIYLTTPSPSPCPFPNSCKREKRSISPKSNKTTAIIISGASSSFEETLNTLKYANRAKNIKTNATRNSLDVNHHISEYVNLIGSLRTEIARLKHQLREPEHRNVGAILPRYYLERLKEDLVYPVEVQPFFSPFY